MPVKVHLTQVLHTSLVTEEHSTARFHAFHAMCTVMPEGCEGKPTLQAKEERPNSGNTQATNVSSWFDLL